MSKVTIEWAVEDGYVGKARPHSFTIDLDDLVDSCDSHDEVMEYIESEVEEQFRQKISAYPTNSAEVVAAWKAAAEAAKEQP